jgi:hypothetical protein
MGEREMIKINAAQAIALRRKVSNRLIEDAKMSRLIYAKYLSKECFIEYCEIASELAQLNKKGHPKVPFFTPF